MEIAIIIMLGAVAALQIYFLITRKTSDNTDSLKAIGDILVSNQKSAAELHGERLDGIAKSITENQTAMNKTVTAMLSQLENRFKSFEALNEQKLENMRTTMEKKLTDIQTDNNSKLEGIQKTVDERLQKTLEEKMNQSFKMVSERLEQVYRGLGEMQSLAVGVGDLKKVLSNVKTRGILGEIQLGAILKEILSAEQYEENVATVPNSRNVVEYAIKIPSGDGKTVYLPIDSKFPLDAYSDLQSAYESGDADAVSAAANVLLTRIKQFAKDVHDKYIEVPYTTEFAIIFLPLEGLYAEVINRGMVEYLQREYHVNIAGPSTMAAFLNSIQMGFRTIAIQKRSMEVWKILGTVKTEFDKFADILENTQQRINQANKELDKLVGVRTRAIQRSLREVEGAYIEEDEE